MSAAIYATEPIYAGDTWPGIPAISIRPNGLIPAIPAESAKLIFFKAEDGPLNPALTLESPANITLVDAASWDFDIPPVVLALDPGEWTFRFSTTADDAASEVTGTGFRIQTADLDSGNLIPDEDSGGLFFSTDGSNSLDYTGEYWRLQRVGGLWQATRYFDGSLTDTWDSDPADLSPDESSWPIGLTVTQVSLTQVITPGTIRTWLLGTLSIL